MAGLNVSFRLLDLLRLPAKFNPSERLPIICDVLDLKYALGFLPSGYYGNGIVWGF